MRSIRWRLQFKSKDGVGCLVNIYDEDYTSGAVANRTGADVPFATESGVTALTGGANPFFYEEDDNEDLLSVVRYRTGYIRVIEKTYGALSSLYPETSTSHYVEFYYGARLDFAGYMQAQSFQNNWVASPRELAFPVISPLGLADGMRLSVINPPARVSLSALLHEVITGLRGAYTSVVIPDIASSLEKTVNSLVVCPRNGDFSQSRYLSNDPFVPISYGEFVEAVCNAFGWMVHDTPAALVFTKFEWPGKYARYALANLPDMAGKATVSPSGNDIVALSDFFNVTGTDGKESLILPPSTIEVEFSGEYVKSADFDFSKMKYHSESHYSNNHAAWFTPVDGAITGQYLNAYGNMFNTSNGHVTNTGITPALCGTRAQQESCLLVKVDPSWSYSAPLFTITFSNRPTSSDFTFKYSAKYGNRVSELKADGDEDVLTHYNLSMVVKCGSKYYVGDGAWQDTATNPITLTEWDILQVPSNDPIVVSFYLAFHASTPEAELIAMSNIRLDEIVAMYDEYKSYVTENAVISGGKGSDMSASVKMLFSSARNNSHMLGDAIEDMPTIYPYLRTAQTRLQADFKGTPPTNPYQPLYSHWITGWRWRIIAMRFTPRDDEYRLTIHRSSCLESLTDYYSIIVTGRVTTDAPARVSKGGYVQFFLFPEQGYAIDYAQVTMGGADVTADCYDGNNYINIEVVSGDVEVQVITSLQ